MLKRIQLVIDLAIGLPVLAMRHRHELVARLKPCSRGDEGAMRNLVIWCRETLAYERRSSDKRYRWWLFCRALVRRLNPGPRSSDPAPPEDVVVLPDGRLSISELDAVRARYLMIESPLALLHPDTHDRLAAVARNSAADAVYCDEDCFVEGRRARPCFKPAFSIDLLRSEDYVGPVFLVRADAAREAIRALGGVETCSSFELLLGLYETGANVIRLAEVLVHWREVRVTALTTAMRDAVSRQYLRLYGAPPGSLPVPARSRTPGSRLISIMIPTKDRLDLLVPCVDSIFAHGSGLDFEIVILNNRSESDEAKRWFESAPQAYSALRIVEADFAFNWSRLNNLGVTHSRGGLLLFLNNDIEVLEASWMQRLAAHAARPDVGVVGPLLLFPHGGIQHAGVVLGLGGYIDHVYSGFPQDAEPGSLFVSPLSRRNVLAVTGACQMIERHKFDEAGGFDESLPICGDIGMSLDLVELGYLNVYDGEVRLLHHESATRARVPISPEEVAALAPRSERFLRDGDPFYNPNLSLQVRMPALSCRRAGVSMA